MIDRVLTVFFGAVIGGALTIVIEVMVFVYCEWRDDSRRMKEIMQAQHKKQEADE